ncbi:hypothetical protein JCM5296_002067 [Sporobolomyces johnsonii]
MATTDELPPGAQWFPLKQHAVLPGSFMRDPLAPSFYTVSTDGALVTPPLDPSKPFLVYHRDFLRILGGNPALTLIGSTEVSHGGDGYPLFHEAGIWIEQTEEVVLTSNCNPEFRNSLVKIKLDAVDQGKPVGKSWELLEPVPAPGHGKSVIASNGGTIYGDKLLMCCQGTDDIPASLSVVDPLQPHHSYPILNNFHGRPFNAINDVAILPPPSSNPNEPHPTTDRTDLHNQPHTTIWFTDPTYASAQGYKKTKPQVPNQVYCFNPTTGDVRCVADGFVMPNGICFNYEGTRCYITDTGMVSGDGAVHPQRPGTVYVYDVVRPRHGADLTAHGPTLHNRRVFAFCDSGIPDGIKTDQEGNVYSGTGEGISVWNSSGTLLGKMVLFPDSMPARLPSTHPDHVARFCANFCFCPRGRLLLVLPSLSSPPSAQLAMAVAAAPAPVSASELSRFTSRRLGTTRERVRSVAWNQDGRRLATGGADKSLRIYLPDKDPRTSTECRGHTGEVSSLRWNPTHPERLASCSASAQDKALHFWDIRQGSKPTSTIETYGDNINMAWSPDGKTIVVGNRSDRLLWVDVEQQTVIKRENMDKETNEVLFSHNGSLLVTAIEGRACINAFPSNEPVHSVRISPVPTTVMDLDPRGRYLAAGSNDATLTLWETQEWTCVSSMGAHDDPLRACRFSHDGAYIASTCSDSEIVISEVPSLRKAHSIKPVNSDSLAWHPSRLLLAYGGDGAHIWGSGV